MCILVPSTLDATIVTEARSAQTVMTAVQNFAALVCWQSTRLVWTVRNIFVLLVFLLETFMPAKSATA